MNRLAIFDCDGTLVDSGATIRGAHYFHFLVFEDRSERKDVARIVVYDQDFTRSKDLI